MGYENAPATALVASHCACCSRPLVDAISVEAGVGPECRRKHGFNDAQGEPAWDDVLGLIGELPDRGFAMQCLDHIEARDAHALANRLVHRIAIEQHGRQVNVSVSTLRALGFRALADRIAKRVVTIRIEVTNAAIVVRAPYSEEAVEAFRGLASRRFSSPGLHSPRAARWDKKSKAWHFHPLLRRELHNTLQRLYPGHTASGPKGLFVLGGAA